MAKKTLFEEIREEVEIENGGVSPFFYRRAFKRLSERYASQPDKFITDERSDNTGKEEEKDKNLLRRIPKPGHLMMFEYETKSKKLKYFDKIPLVYVTSISGTTFEGCNLHYIEPKRRQIIVENLMEGRLMLPYNSMSKYSINQVQGLFLDIAFNEWITAINIPIENFVKIEDGQEKTILMNDVWKDTNRTFRKMLKGVRVYRGYGKNDLDFRGNF
jgi:hypothetical protein